MTGGPSTSLPIPPTGGSTPEESSVEIAGSPRAGEPMPPGSSDGRARAFREREAERRKLRRDRVGAVLVVVIILLGVYAIAAARPYNPSNQSSQPKPGPPILVTLGTPILRQITCSSGASAYAERIPWNGSTATVTTGDVAVHLYEVIDGDFIPDIQIIANATPTNPCAGAPPPAMNWLWYVVLSAPNGTNILAYDVTQGWTAIGGGTWNIPIENGSAVTVITGMSASQRGLGFAVVGFSNGSTIAGTVPL